jgi:hypothetical protein
VGRSILYAEYLDQLFIPANCERLAPVGESFLSWAELVGYGFAFLAMPAVDTEQFQEIRKGFFDAP